MSEESLLSTAYQFIQQSETQTAERLLTGLIRQEPQNEAAWLLLAACKTQQEEKKKCLEFVAEINPNNSAALEALGDVLAGRDATTLILHAFEDWQMRQEAAEKKESQSPVEEIREAIAPPALTMPIIEEDTRPLPQKRIRTIWLWVAIILLAAGQALAWLRIWQLEAALAVAENSLVTAHANIQSLQNMLTDYIVQIELLRELLP